MYKLKHPIIILYILFSSVVSYSQLMVETFTTSFEASGGISVDKNGVIYVANFGALLNNANGTQVWKLFPDGSKSIFATGLFGASGNCFGPDGYLYQSNIAANRISKIDTNGNVVTFATANIFNPVGVAIDKMGNVFVANCGSNTIAKITSQGVSSVYASSNLLSCPNGLTIDSNRNLYTCNFSNGNVLKIDTTGTVSILATIPGGTAYPGGNNGHLTFANEVLYVVGRGGNQIWEVTLDGDTTLIAGTGIRGQLDGPALESTWSVPNGIRASLTGDTLYINDAVPLSGPNLNPIVVRRIFGLTTSVQSLGSETPDNFNLYQNYPNPFNPSTKIKFDIANASNVSLKVYDSLGRLVRVVFDKKLSAGSYESRFVADQLPSGVYYYSLITNNDTQTNKMILVR